MATRNGARVSVLFTRHMEKTRAGVVAAAGDGALSAATEARRLMLERTEAGVDVDGRRFAAYAARTKAKRAAAGKITSRVNLRFHSDMLDALSVRRVRGSNGNPRGEVYFKSSHARAMGRRHIFGTKRMPRRDFFGVARDERRLVNAEHGRTVRTSVPGRLGGDRRGSLKIMLIQVNRTGSAR